MKTPRPALSPLVGEGISLCETTGGRKDLGSS